MFLLDMASPGVEVRPLRQMTGRSNFNEVFFDDVRIPVENILGEPGDGWRMATADLMNERASFSANSTEKADRLAAISTQLELARKRDLMSATVVRQALMDLV